MWINVLWKKYAILEAVKKNIKGEKGWEQGEWRQKDG